MLFPTIDFALFFLVVFTGNWLLRPHRTAWKLFILASSFFFYGYWFSERSHLPLATILAFTIVVNWAFGQAVFRAMTPDGQRTERSRWLVRAAVVVDLGVLGYFKYVNFFLSSVTERLSSIGVHVSDPTIGVILPIGISFFTFQAISYVIDIGRGVWRRPVALLDFAVYLSFFAHLIAGPIVRASEFVPQLEETADPRFVETSEAFMLIFRGLFKKVVISSYMATIVDPVFALPNGASRWEVLWAIYAYAIQIYADFSGYTDMAIGVALLLGIRFPQNFDAPYIALTVQDFWRRWHITLSRWLRDYLYIPLGGNRGTELFTYRNLFLTMVIGGLWHGANWTFVVWGALHGAYLVAERVVKKSWAERGAIGLPPPMVKVLQWLLTFNFVCFAWIFFRAPNFTTATDVIGRLFSGSGTSALVTPLLIITVVGMLASQFVPERIPSQVTERFAQLAPVVQIVALGVGIALVDALGPEGIAPFIYFQF
jgi:D-alanyl-lipoteichoic acid acyltransferase DltB (MBOAT superfamily)